MSNKCKTLYKVVTKIIVQTSVCFIREYYRYLKLRTSRAASTMVVIWERSPHSARNVNVND